MIREFILLGFLLVLGLCFNQAVASEPSGSTEARAIQPKDLVLLEERSRVFRITDGDKLDERLELSLRPATDDKPGEWVLEFSDLNTVYLSVNEGALVIERLDLPPEGRAVVYEPPVRLIPAELRPHETINEESKARIYDLETDELQHRGTVRHEVKFASRSRFSTDVGTFEGFMIPIEQEIDLPGTQIVLELAGGYVPDTGIVYRRVDYTRITLGFFGETIRRTAVLSRKED